MRVIFFCGCVEPGKDGVGDYTLQLATKLIDTNTQVYIIAINDKYVYSPIEEYRTADKLYIPVLRLPKLSSWNDRVKLIVKSLRDFNPDWLSLQYVPFSYNNKGLPFSLHRNLKKISSNIKWHIMFHELWVGIDKQASNKYKVWGAIQRNLIKSAIKVLQPKIVHTQTRLYQQLLRSIGCEAIYLPLFGNIQVGGNIIVPKRKGNKKTLSLVLFGSIHYGAPIKEFSKEVAMFSSETGYPVSLTFVGRCGTEIEKWIEAWTSEGLSVTNLGEQPPHIISTTLSKADFGIVTTPPVLLEKSGSVAAMREHRLPIICISRTWEPRYKFMLNLPHGISIYTPGNLKNIFNATELMVAPVTLNTVAKQFLNDLN